MVEINNRQLSVPRYAGVVGGEPDNGRQKTRNHGYDIIVSVKLLLITPITLSWATLNPKLKSTGAGRYQLLSRWWDAYRKQLGLKDFSEKSGRCGIATD